MPDVHLGKGATVGTRDPDARRDHSGGGRRRHRLRHGAPCRRRSTATDLPDSLAALRAPIERACRSASAHTSAAAPRDALSAGAALERRRTQLSRAATSACASWIACGKFDHERVVASARHARRRQSLHRALPRRGGSRLGRCCTPAAQRRQHDRRDCDRDARASIAEREQRHLPDRDLAWLDEGSAEFAEYVDGLRWAQDYAALNRDMMLRVVLQALRAAFPRAVAVARARGQLPSQLRRARRRTSAQTCGSRAKARFGARRRARHHSGQHGRAVVHRARQGQRRVLSLVQPRRRAADVAQRGAPAVHPRRPARRRPRASNAARTPGVIDETPGGVQGHRRRDGGAARPGRDRAHS